MALRRTPVVVGVGDYKNRSQKVEDAIEPSELMLRAISIAINDSKAPAGGLKKLQASIDSIDVVATWTWPYSDLPSLLSQKLGVKPEHKFYSAHGGNKSAKLFDEAARRISFGKSKVAVVTGGEALASCMLFFKALRKIEFLKAYTGLVSACAAANKLPPPGWTKSAEEVDGVFSPTSRSLGSSTIGKTLWTKPSLTSYGYIDLGAIHSIGAPIHVYPLYENGFRAHRRQSILQNNQESARLYGDFAKVAEKNPVAWNYGKPAETEKSIGTVTKKNRMISFPCSQTLITS
jgi:hypothetical protein